MVPPRVCAHTPGIDVITRAAQRALSLPMSADLSDQQLEHVVHTLRAATEA